jgi:hypothetical protein
MLLDGERARRALLRTVSPRQYADAQANLASNPAPQDIAIQSQRLREAASGEY